jgi:uncharacterized membrane protein YfcA
MIDGILLPVIAILLAATLVRASLGFGDGLIAVSLMSLLMPVEQAAPVAVLMSITTASIILVRDWREVHFRSAGWLLGATLLGIPLGLMLLTSVPEVIVKTLLALVIMGFSLYSLLNRGRHELKSDRYAWLFGFQAGILGGAYGMNGPPLAIYGALRRWRPEHFRATLQAYFLPASMAGMAGYWLAGLWTPAVDRFYLAGFPAIVLAAFAGRIIGRRLEPQRFRMYVYGFLMVIGLILLIQSLRMA